jgi:hypothetical protein
MKLRGMETQISSGDGGKCACQQAVSLLLLALQRFVRTFGTDYIMIWWSCGFSAIFLVGLDKFYGFCSELTVVRERPEKPAHQ